MMHVSSDHKCYCAFPKTTLFRSLCNFDINVLLCLIWSVISQIRVFYSLNTGLWTTEYKVGKCSTVCGSLYTLHLMQIFYFTIQRSFAISNGVFQELMLYIIGLRREKKRDCVMKTYLDNRKYFLSPLSITRGSEWCLHCFIVRRHLLDEYQVELWLPQLPELHAWLQEATLLRRLNIGRGNGEFVRACSVVSISLTSDD